jgi:DNA invertase Pin-like site-specific DNA recombinase
VIRRQVALLVSLALACAGVAAAPAAAQDRGGGPPTELRDEFPLEQPPRGQAQARSAEVGGRPARSGGRGADDGGFGPAIPLLLGALGALAAAGFALRRRAVTGGGAAAMTPPQRPATASSGDRAQEAASTPVRSEATTAAAPATGAAVAELESPPAPGAAADNAPSDARSSRRPPAKARALGYASVSAANGQNNAELTLQTGVINEACQRRGLTLVNVVRDVGSHAGSDLRRPGLMYALERLAARDASCLVVTSIERLTRTAAHLGTMLGWLEECDARLVVIDLDLDTGTHEGRLGAEALATVGGPERRKVEERTREGLEAARNMRRSGRPAVSDRPSLKQRIADMRAQGMTLQAIADALNAEGVPTLRGGVEWRPSSVQAAAGYKRPSRRDRPRARERASRDNRS